MTQEQVAGDVFDVFSEYAIDPVTSISGVRRELGKGAWVLVARADNRKYNREFAKALETHREALAKQDDAADELSNRIMAEVFAKTILLGFGGMYYQGKPIEYSYENAVKLLKHENFRVRIGQLSNEEQQYKAKLEVDQGNP